MAKILLVDDHPDIIRLLQICLRSEPHTLLTAFNGREALEVIEAERPDLVILDVVMPELDGIRVLHRIKTHPEWHTTLVAMHTVHDSQEDMSMGLTAGADFYLSKPFKPSEVVGLVRRVLGPAADE